MILLSWLINERHLGSSRDFYLEELQQAFADRGLSSLLLLRNQTSSKTDRLIPLARRDGRQARRLLPDTLGPAEELALWRRIERGRSRLRATAASMTHPADRIVAYEASKRMAPALVAPGLRLHAQLRELTARTRPLIFVTLYEGHAWERCAWHAVRAGHPGTLRVAYQFTIVLQRAYALRQSFGPPFDPDVLMTTGDTPREVLQRTPDLAHMRIMTFGSYRRAAGPAVEPGWSRDVLVLPDGLESETTLLLEFAVSCARALPQTRFRLRPHPLVSRQQVRAALSRSGQPPNVEVSEGTTLDVDLARSGAVMYRGSSAVYTAVLAGLKPFHVKQRGEVGLDTLEGLTVWREQVSSPEDFSAAYAAFARRPEHDHDRERRVAQAYCDRYFSSVDTGVLDDLIAIARGGSSQRFN